MAKERSPNGMQSQDKSARMSLQELTPLTNSTKNRQLASLSAKVQAYEDVISKLSNRFGVSDEQLVNIALAAV
jgi:hypothetical protein